MIAAGAFIAGAILGGGAVAIVALVIYDERATYLDRVERVMAGPEAPYFDACDYTYGGRAK